MAWSYRAGHQSKENNDRTAFPYFCIVPKLVTPMKEITMTSTYNHISPREAWLEAVLVGIDKCTLVTDPDGYLMLINEKAAKTLELNPDTLIGKRLDAVVNLFDDDLQSKQPFLIHAVTAIGQPLTSEHAEKIVLQNGRTFHANYRLAPIRNAENEPVAILLTFSKAVGPSLEQEELVRPAFKQALLEQLNDKKSAIFVRSSGKYIRVWLDELYWIEAMENYIQLRVGKDRIMVHSTLKNIFKMLSQRGFVRIHRSVVVRTNAIETIEENHVVIQGERLPIGKSFRAGLLASLNLV